MIDKASEVKQRLQGISTRDFLGILDHDQLLSAIEIARELMALKDAEPRVPIWIVSDDCRLVGGFHEHDYEKAVERARQLLDEEAKRGRGFIVEVESVLKRESEVVDMLALSL